VGVTGIPDIQAALSRGWQLQQAGDLVRAAAIYRQILQTDPHQADALHLLAAVCLRQGKHAEAEAGLRQLLRLRPDHATAHHNLGIALAGQGRLDEAIASFQEALRLAPTAPDTYGNLGLALLQRDRPEEAVDYFEQALRLEPGNAETQSNLAVALVRLGRLDEAIACWRQVVRLRPQDPEAHNSLGGTLAKRGHLEEAVASLRQALRLRPRHGDTHSNLGLALAELGRLDEALAHLQTAVRLQPDSAAVQSNLGLALIGQGRFDEAIAHLREALRLRPNFPEAHNNLGMALTKLGRFDEGIRHYDEALRQNPDHPEAHKNRALAWLVLGDYARGWPEFEWRWRCKDFTPRPFRPPQWDGAPLAGRSILLHTEQGIGDTLQFIRYAALVKQRGGTVLVECPAGLRPLLASCPGIDRLLARGEPLPPFDVHAPLLSLPTAFQTTLDTVPAPIPYLRPDPAHVEKWRRELEPGQEFKIGIVWRGSPHYKADRQRSIPLAHFGPLTRVEGVRLYSLQKGPGSEEVSQLADRLAVTDLGSRLDEVTGAFLDTAAVMHRLDLVVTADTAAGHLAGAMGVPVWIALPFSPDWRWQLDREDSPWYPTVRLFRQQTAGDWDAVFERMAAELARQLGARRFHKPILVETAAGDLIDKITILEIKSERIVDTVKLRHVREELAVLVAARDRAMEPSPELTALTAELKAANETIWDTEDALRLCESKGDFGPHFVELARRVYHTNDRRAALKRRINELLVARLMEVKVHPEY
jgi:tetratricopeptide (TPR) repeat protein